MVRALREMVRVLKPSGPLIDLRPIGGPAPLEIVRDGVGKKVYEIDGSPGIPDDEASDRAVELLVGEGTLVEESRQEFLFHHYWDSIEEMHEQATSEWGCRNVIPTLDELEPARAAHEAKGPGASVRVSRLTRQCVYRIKH